MSPYSGNEFAIDEDQNLLLDTSKEGTFNAKITPDMNKNYAYLDIEMKVLPDATPNYLNIAPHFIQPLEYSNKTFDFSLNKEIMAKLNAKKS